MSTRLFTTVNEPTRLDRAVQSLTDLSRAGVRGLLDHNCVRVNGTLSTAGQTMLDAGAVVEVRFDPHTRVRERPVIKDDPAFRLLFEDEHILVVNKAAHVLTVPTDRGRGKTLMDALQRHLDRAHHKPRGGTSRPTLHIIQRLDLGVSGVMVVAKTAQASANLRKQFASHKPERIYLAIVNGIIDQSSGTFRSYLTTDRALNRYSTTDAAEGELAITHYQTQSHARGATVVRVTLETGQRNQIRVHFAEAGHPVLGDPRYPRQGQRAPRPLQPGRQTKTQVLDLTSAHPKWKARRMALHAHSLMFEHPATREVMRFETEVPKEFAPFMTDSRSSKRTHAPAKRNANERR